MMQVIKKWKVIVYFVGGGNMILYFNDNFYSNMLRQLSQVGFELEPIKVVIQTADDTTYNESNTLVQSK